jgi:threonine dehydrogenase-like Zn-dependent dehydrogenase
MQKSKSIISLVLTLALTSQLFSCGYFLHPERREQKSKGNVDWAIAGLDAVGLIFFIVPGLIAFAVDVSSGTLYLPKHSSQASNLDWKNATKIKIDPNNLSEASIAKAIKENTGVKVDFNDPHLEIHGDKRVIES